MPRQLVRQAFNCSPRFIIYLRALPLPPNISLRFNLGHLNTLTPSSSRQRYNFKCQRTAASVIQTCFILPPKDLDGGDLALKYRLSMPEKGTLKP